MGQRRGGSAEHGPAVEVRGGHLVVALGVDAGLLRAEEEAPS